MDYSSPRAIYNITHSFRFPPIWIPREFYPWEKLEIDKVNEEMEK
jgi:hypothetical protein